MVHFKNLVILVFMMFCTFYCNAQQQNNQLPKMAAPILRDDMTLLKKILEANHPSLYWFTPKEILDGIFDSLYQNIPDSMNEIAFKNHISSWIINIKCGHTACLFSKSFLKNINQYRYPKLPLQLKVWDDTMVVIGNASQKDSLLKRGTIIQSINGKNTSTITADLFKLISTDGNAINHKYQILSNNFADWYKQYYGVDSTYHIKYFDTLGCLQETSIQHFELPKKTGLKSVAIPKVEHPLSKRALLKLSRRSLQIDTTNARAYMRLTSFSKGSLKRFFRRSFKSIQKNHINDLIIDLRENGGGKVDNSIKLSKYLINHPFKIGDTVMAASRKFKYSRYISPSFIYWVAMNFGGTKAADGSIHYRRYEQHYFKPKAKHHYNGSLYLLQGGYTFSAATMFIASLKNQEKVKLVGEETGGGYYGNSAMHIPIIELPNSKLRVSLPMYRLVMDKNRSKGRGIFPDIYIPPSAIAIRAGIDKKMSVVNELISIEKEKAVLH